MSLEQFRAIKQHECTLVKLQKKLYKCYKKNLRISVTLKTVNHWISGRRNNLK